MLHSYTKIWIHLIWTTKNRVRILKPEIRPLIHQHLLEYAQASGTPLERLNIQPEHIHSFFNLPSDKTLQGVVKALKGESAHWINENGFLGVHFNWQRGYGAFSISASQIEQVKRYIQNQDEHHKKRSFREEYDLLLRKYGFQIGGNR
ncbi:IS200/IS605 family transposase [candidate division KSB1 bacterium]|nr:IS200/IS605 family transposase [candidate division KSB1 bacterium]